jgi:hypothetical protein
LLGRGRNSKTTLCKASGYKEFFETDMQLVLGLGKAEQTEETLSLSQTMS